MSEAWVALAGTVVGGLISYIFQRMNISRADTNAKAERLRSEKLAAYSEFASVLLEYRRVQLHRWHLVLDSARPEQVEEAEHESRRCRATAWTAFYRVKLLSDDQVLLGQADRALETMREFASVADSRSRVDAQGRLGRKAVEEFIDSAKAALDS
jgi:hypothetical protein